MHLEYEITEQDFLDGQHLAIKNHPKRTIRWMRHYFFVLGIIGLGYFVQVVITQGFSLRLVWGRILPLVFISYPMLNTWQQERMYRKATVLHGRFHLDVSDDGWASSGPSFQGKVAWSHFSNYFENDKCFVIFQTTQIFNIIPKCYLSAEQVSELRQYLDRIVGKSKS